MDRGGKFCVKSTANELSHRRMRNASFSTYTNVVSSNCTAAPELESRRAVRWSRMLLPSKPAIRGSRLLVKYRIYEKERWRYSVEKAGSEKRYATTNAARKKLQDGSARVTMHFCWTSEASKNDKTRASNDSVIEWFNSRSIKSMVPQKESSKRSNISCTRTVYLVDNQSDIEWMNHRRVYFWKVQT